MDYWTAFTLGLVGSLHCAGMCGPLALALPSCGKSPVGFLLGRTAYNLGRILTYCLFGFAFGLLGRTLAVAGFQRWVSIALGIAVLVGLFASKTPGLSWHLSGLVGCLKSSMSGLLRRRSYASLALLGLLNGLLPCGLVYVACAGATATGDVPAAVGYMAAFGAGTLPMMLALSLSGKLVPFSLRLKLQKAIPASAFLLALLLILRGMALGVPYLSPNLAAGAIHCH